MARVKLSKDYKSHKAGAVIEVPAGEAERLILQRIGELSPLPLERSISLAKLQNGVRAFKDLIESLKLDDDEVEPANGMLRELVAPLIPEIFPAMEEIPGQQGPEVPECLYANLVDNVFPRLNERLESLLNDETADPEKVGALNVVLDEFVEKWARTPPAIAEPPEVSQETKPEAPVPVAEPVKPEAVQAAKAPAKRKAKPRSAKPKAK